MIVEVDPELLGLLQQPGEVLIAGLLDGLGELAIVLPKLVGGALRGELVKTGSERLSPSRHRVHQREPVEATLSEIDAGVVDGVGEGGEVVFVGDSHGVRNSEFLRVSAGDFEPDILVFEDPLRGSENTRIYRGLESPAAIDHMISSNDGP